jgi:hypothetical protein
MTYLTGGDTLCQAEGCMNLMLVYPAGFEEDPEAQAGQEEAGNINIVRGAHLYCDTAAESPAAVSGHGSEANDTAMRDGWLKGKLHPETGAPLVCERLQLPPGSLICCEPPPLPFAVVFEAHRIP